MTAGTAETKVLQVTNISPSATEEQMKTLFSFLGSIDDFKVFPKTNIQPVGSKVGFVKYHSASSVTTGLHLTNTVFIDKAMICVAYAEGKIPEESIAMQYVSPVVPAMGAGSEHQLPGNVDPNKVDEIRRTIYVGNLDSKTATAEQLLQFFTTCGEVKFVRMAGDETQPTRFAFVEFADQNSVENALQLNGMLFGDRPIKVNHSNNAIVKPQGKTQETAAKEIEEAMRRVREAQSLITRALEPEVKEKKRRTRSRSRSRHHRRHSRSRSRSRKRRKSRSRSRGRSRRSRSRSRSRKRSHRRRTRSRSKKRSRSRKRSSRSRSRRSRKRSSSPKKKRSRSRSPSKKSSRHKKDRKRDKEHRDKDKKKRRHSGSRSGSEEKSKKEVNIEKKKDEEVVEKKPTEENGSSVIVPAEKAIKNVETITNGQTSPVET